MESVVIQLLGREYKVSVRPEEKESLQAAVAMVTERLQQMASKTNSGTESMAVMALLNLAHEYVVSKSSPGLDLPAYRRKIETMGERIDFALAKQETLF